MEQDHVPAGRQELCSHQVGDPQKPSAQGEFPQMSMTKSCLDVCLGPELCLASCSTMEGIPSHTGGQGSWVPGRGYKSRDALQAAAGFLSRASSHPQLWLQGPLCSWSCSRPQSPIQSLRMVVRTCSRASPRGSPRQPGRKGTWAVLPAPQSPVWHKVPEGSNSSQASPVLAARYKTDGSFCCPPCPGLAVCG